ncbi:MAG: FAD-binding oxidoreductase [Alphaproteobacteria bacterium]|jgi:glycine/D-amino acid oxidase-like deaminating enzyme|nr:FAD-binding oxidoreductase [Alphaproteobacteria bacterium]
MPETFDAIVVGAGITGASTAYHLKKRGLERVLLVEREAPAAGGTGKSAAIIRQHYSTPVLSALTRDGVAMLSAMEEELGQPSGFVQSGWYFLVPEEMLEQAERNIAMHQELGIETGMLTERTIIETMPWLNREGVGRVVHEPLGGYADPVQATEAYVAGFKALGGDFRDRTPVRRLLRQPGRITGIETDDDEISAGTTVNAAGPWACFLAESAGLELPLRAVREQDTVWQARGNRPLPTAPISNAVDATYIRPLGENRYVLGRGYPKDYVDVDPYNYKLTADDDFIRVVQERVEHRVPPMAGMTLIASYAALYDVTPDWYPFYGPRQGLKGYADASGGSGHGFKIGPAAGRTLADWIVDGETSDAFRALSYDRVPEDRLFTGNLGGNRG